MPSVLAVAVAAGAAAAVADLVLDKHLEAPLVVVVVLGTVALLCLWERLAAGRMLASDLQDQQAEVDAAGQSPFKRGANPVAWLAAH